MRRINMIKLNQKGLEELRKDNKEMATNLEKYVAEIQHSLYVSEDCTIWVEDPSLIEVFNRLPFGRVRYKGNPQSYGDMLCQIISRYAKAKGVNHVIVDNEFQESDSSLYASCEVWIMTANFFFTTLFATFKDLNFPTNELEEFASAVGFTFKIKNTKKNSNKYDLSAFKQKQLDLQEYTCLGHVYDYFPEYAKTGAFYRGFIFEVKPDLKIVAHNIGNGYYSFLCEATKKDMEKFLNEEY